MDARVCLISTWGCSTVVTGRRLPINCFCSLIWSYGFEEPGNDIERGRVDLKFYIALITRTGMKKCIASAFSASDRTGGKDVYQLFFSWGDAVVEC